MQTLKKNYDRVLATVLAFITLIVSATLVAKSFAIGDKFVIDEVIINPLPDGEAGDGIPKELVARLDKDHLWVAPVGKHGEPLRAFASGKVYWHEDGIVCPFDDPPVRGNVPTPWILKYGLPIERSDVLELDSDGDDFTNLEEFRLGTNPTDSDSHPDVLHKLFLADVRAEDCFLTFASSAGGSVNIRKRGGWRAWLEVDAVLPGGRHQLVKLNDHGVLLKEIATGREVVLPRRETTNVPVYRAVFDFAIDRKQCAPEGYALGEAFTLPRGGGRCTVTEIDSKSVRLSVEKADGSAVESAFTLLEAD